MILTEGLGMNGREKSSEDGQASRLPGAVARRGDQGDI